MSEPIRILIVEDQFFFRLALHTMIDSRSDMTIVAETGTGREAVELYSLYRPNVTIMDLRLPGISGFDAIKAILDIDGSARILVLSNYQGTDDVHRALRAGALAYILKDTGSEEQLIQAIQAVHCGIRYLPVSVGARLAEHVQNTELTQREMDVLRLLSKGLSNRDIGERLNIAEKTVRIHMSHILEKLGAADRTQAVIVAVQRGIVHLES
jgi:DNA-binding NarL/FixJ family response regulator